MPINPSGSLPNMPRKLPWATKDSPIVKERKRTPAPRKREAASSDIEKDDTERSMTSTPDRAVKKRAKSRTLSTSPPPGPPDEKYMEEGYDHDDMYIMVEDEFHSIAQTFTQHLHHAEYQRLKKKAKNATPPEFKPTEAMRVEARKKIEARALRARQKDALENITNGVSLSADEEEEHDDPWLGTSLAGLMTDASKQKRMALVGLEKVQSSTRAAKGFGRGTGDSPAGRVEKMSVFDIFSAQKKGNDAALEQEDESSEVDLDPPSVQAPPSRPNPQETSIGRKADDSHDQRSKAAASAASSKPRSPMPQADPKPCARFREPSVAARKLFENFDNFEDSDNISSVARKSKPPPLASPSRKDRRPKSVKDRKMQLNDIPTFLI